MDLAEILSGECIYQEMKILKMLSLYHVQVRNYDHFKYGPFKDIVRSVFQYVSLKSKFTQKYFPNHGGYIYIMMAIYKILYLYLTIYFAFKRSLSICHIIQQQF